MGQGTNMKFSIYNPEPLNSCSNPCCSRFHSKTQNPSHIFDCYRKAERLPINFQCSNRILKLSEPHPRHSNKKYEQKKWSPWTKTFISKNSNVSNRLEHLAAPIFRRVYLTRQTVESHRNVSDCVKQNLNLHIQRSMYNVYSRLQNVKFPNILDSRRISMRRSIKSSAFDFLKSIERLSQPRKIPVPEPPAIQHEQKRPISWDTIERLSMPRKIPVPEQIRSTLPKQPLQGEEYYKKLAQPRKILEDEDKRDSEPKLTSMKRINEISVPLSRLQRRKFMKGDNEQKFSVSRAALLYKATAKINKLAVPRKKPEDQSSSKRKK